MYKYELEYAFGYWLDVEKYYLAFLLFFFFNLTFLLLLVYVRLDF